MFGELTISGLLIGTSSIGFLANHFVLSEVFCGETLQYSYAYLYERTYIEFNNIPKGIGDCIIRIFDGINIFTKIIKIQ